MYQKPFYITNPVWNNALSFEKRQNKKLFVPSLIEITDFSKIEFWNEIVFEDFDFDWKLISAKGLENFYKIPPLNLPLAGETSLNSSPARGRLGGGIKAPIYLFDNHNHAYYFWYLARSEWIIWDNNILYHIDEHADMRDPEKYLLKPDSFDLEKVFKYTNFELNVWNYIIPAQKEGIIWNIVQIRSENDLKPSPLTPLPLGEGDIILNLDLDFFEPNLDYIDYELKKKVILEIAKKAKIITVATSPFFIDQELALRVFRDIFAK